MIAVTQNREILHISYTDNQRDIDYARRLPLSRSLKEYELSYIQQRLKSESYHQQGRTGGFERILNVLGAFVDNARNLSFVEEEA